MPRLPPPAAALMMSGSQWCAGIFIATLRSRTRFGSGRRRVAALRQRAPRFYRHQFQQFGLGPMKVIPLFARSPRSDESVTG